ncbi:MAG: DNA polymerase III subunit delta' [Gammaproteobacteria bacterium]
MSAPYPWLDPAWQELAPRRAQGRLAHAYLLAGREGLGKLAFAVAFARLALCEAATVTTACRRCRSCVLLDTEHHPDLFRVEPEQERKSIGVDQIRELIDFYTLKSHYGHHKVAIVHPAEMMTTNAANALLKVLEEPPPGALFLLVSHRTGQLPATILSRCQRVTLADPDWPACLAWLDARRQQQPALADARVRSVAGAPLTLLAQLEDDEASLYDRVIDALHDLASGSIGVLEAARRLSTGDAWRTIEALELVIRAVAQLAVGAEPRHIHLAPEHRRHLHDIANKLHSARLFAFLDRISEARSTLARSSGIRGGEAIENLLYQFARTESAETTS